MVRQTEKRQVICGNRLLEYQLIRKSVKNINLRVKPDGTVAVSANERVASSYVDRIVQEKQEFIFRALDRYEKDGTQRKKGLEAEECQIFEKLCAETYEQFRHWGYAVPNPTLKLRYMTSRWGSCQPQKGIITLNSQLIEKPRCCIEYVVVHEFAHFVHANHSKAFYQVVEQFLPDWKERKKELNKR